MRNNASGIKIEPLSPRGVFKFMVKMFLWKNKGSTVRFYLVEKILCLSK